MNFFLSFETFFLYFIFSSLKIGVENDHGLSTVVHHPHSDRFATLAK